MTTTIRNKPKAFSYEEKQELWHRWKAGDSIVDIAQSLKRWPGSVRPIIKRHGGIPPRARVRSARALTLAEREEISRGLCCGLSIRTIARQLNRAPSTVSREVNRNGGRAVYRASQADGATWARARRPKPCKLTLNPRLSRWVAAKLKLNWSPEQIGEWLKRAYPNQPEVHVSHETIYKTLYVQARGALKKELTKHLRTRRTLRKSKLSGSGKTGYIPDAVSISRRPPEIEDRAIPGHWEGDLILGSNNSQIATLVERSTRYVMLMKINSRTTEEVVSSLIEQSQNLPTELYKSLTWDRGAEMKRHVEFTVATNVQVYFCDPASPWQRGSNENTNGLLRQYFPKRTDLSVFKQEELDKVARELNERPRKTLGFETPAERFEACVASIG